MSALSNPRHEAFAQKLAKGKSAAEAYEEVGYSANRHNASALARKEHISTRVAELQSEAATMAQEATRMATEALGITVETLIAEAEEARLLAMQIQNPGAAIAAIKEKGILSGKRVEKAETKSTIVRSHEDMLDDLERASTEEIVVARH